MISGQFISLIILAILIATPLAIYFMSGWLQQYVYRINISWWIYGATAGIVVLIAMITICVQSIGVALANPVKSLRTE
jgi:hypothetical protein